MDIFSCLKEKAPNFSKGQKRIAAYIEENREEASYSTAAIIAKKVGVSESTVVRFALELGYSGYPEMQKALQQQLLYKNVPQADGQADGISRALTLDAAQLRNTHNTLHQDLLRAAAEATARAGTVYVYGQGNAAFIAEPMKNALLRLRSGVRLLRESTAEELCRELLDAGDGDVFLMISTPQDVRPQVLKLPDSMGCVSLTLGCSGGSFAFPVVAEKDLLIPVSLLTLLHAFLGALQDLRKDTKAQRSAQVSEILRHLEEVSHEL